MSYLKWARSVSFAILVLAFWPTLARSQGSNGKVTGELKVWYPVTVDFTGPAAKEMDANPNPFLDFRLQVLFTGPAGQTYNVPGFFDGDGLGNGDGTVWRVRFSPDQAGAWTYKASFRQGKAVATETDAAAGATAGFDGAQGNFTVGPRDPNAPGFLKMGVLEYVGKSYLKYRDGGYFIKGGADDPENLLGYAGFDNAKPGNFGLLDYKTHEKEWQPGDPDWGNGKGKAFIGMLNYLGSQHVNSVYFLPMNIGGDGQDSYPFASESIDRHGSPNNDDLHYDVSKLTQWNTVFFHAQRQGVHLHFVLDEAEKANKQELDNGELGVERKLYYRELIARFGYLLSLQWNLCEEYDLDWDFTSPRIKAFASYIKSIDPMKHPLTVHNNLEPSVSFKNFFGDKNFDLMSVQYNPTGNELNFDKKTEQLRSIALASGRPITISFDEFDRLSKKDDDTREAGWPNTSGWSRLRKAVLWPCYFSGSMVEYITVDLLNLNDFHAYEGMWKYTWYARKFMEEQLPFADMVPDDALLTGASPDIVGGQVIALKGKIYGVYYPKASATGSLNLVGAPGTYDGKWYNPRTGVFEGAAFTLEGEQNAAIPAPPSAADQDWTLLLRNRNYTTGIQSPVGGEKSSSLSSTNRWQRGKLKVTLNGVEIQMLRPDGRQHP